MKDSKYTIERTIENITFSQMKVEELRENIRHELIDEGHQSIDDSIVEERLQEKLEKIAIDQTLIEQGDNSLHTDIEFNLTTD